MVSPGERARETHRSSQMNYLREALGPRQTIPERVNGGQLADTDFSLRPGQLQPACRHDASFGEPVREAPPRLPTPSRRSVSAGSDPCIKAAWTDAQFPERTNPQTLCPQFKQLRHNTHTCINAELPLNHTCSSKSAAMARQWKCYYLIKEYDMNYVLPWVSLLGCRITDAVPCDLQGLRILISFSWTIFTQLPFIIGTLGFSNIKAPAIVHRRFSDITESWNTAVSMLWAVMKITWLDIK